MFYLKTHSIYFILRLYGVRHNMVKNHSDTLSDQQQGFFIWKEGNVLFNDTLNTFYLWLYGVRPMVKDHSDSKRGNPLSPNGLLFVTPVVEHWLEREIAQWVHSMKD